ncbi:MAG TPA: fumarylacetoacetate hydrolase family protein, partial [Gammaproteobacteria bacterium]|nr:fumarylacetoacetate hydrolase family protein [Gammaproteobacteria bacterium]
LLAPIPRPPRNIFCVGKNYRDHVQEVRAIATRGDGQGLPEVPIFFTKATSAVIGPGQPIPTRLDPTDTTDYEGELAVVIGRGGRDIAAADAWDHIYGFTIINDATSRGLQFRHQQWFLGKSLDGFCPMGPVIVTADEVADVTALCVQTRVNGELRQDGRLDQLIFDIPTLVQTLAATMTLEPGDIIATGTPAGVGMGFEPPRYLRGGDEVAITIEPIGTLRNPVE